MSHAFAEIAFTPSVKAAQQRDGSRSNYARNFEGDAEVDFITAQRSFYMALNDRVALILMDYAQRVRLKLLGRLVVQDLAPQDALAKTLIDPAYRARPQRAMVITVEGFDWNCPQHIPVRIDAEDVQRVLDQRDARIAELEERIAHSAAGSPASG